MRIAIISLHHAEYVSGLTKSLAKSSEVLLILNEKNFAAEVGDLSVLKGMPRLRTVFMPQDRNPLGVLPRAVRLLNAIRQFKPDVIHCQEDTRDYLALALPFMSKWPFVLTVHDPRPHTGEAAVRRARSRHGLYLKQLRRHSDTIIVHGDSMLPDAESAFPRLKGSIFSIPHGPNGRLRGEAIPFDWEPGVCLFFGRIEEYKGLPYFIAAIRALRAEGVAVTGVIAGRGPELDRLIPQLAGDTAFVVEDRFLTPPEVRAWFLRANVVVMPYLNATQSGVLAYAFGLGRPVVASRVGGLPDVVQDGVSGLLVPPQDVASLAAAIRKIIEDSALARRMSAAAIGLAEGPLSWATIARQTEEVYRHALRLRGH